jgi:site-specific DNA recombinase
MKIIGYARVSTEEQAREGVSLDSQKAKITGYCELYNHESLEIIVDAGQSAKTVNREGMHRLIDMTNKRKPEIHGIVVYKLDRLFRNAEEALRYTTTWDKKGIALHSVQEQLDTKSAMGRFFFTMMAAIAEMERNVISERTASALQFKRKNGEKTGGDVPFGFNLIERGGKKALEPKEVEQKAIRLMKQLRAEGRSYREIATELEAKGIATKRGRSRWFPMTVKQTLNGLEQQEKMG